MLTFSLLGKYGRLGNQMFQYAAVIGIAKNKNFDYCFPLQQTDIQKYFNLTAKNQLYSARKITINRCSFEPMVFNLPDELDYIGYFQTEKYFKHCSDFIRKEFTFKDKIKQKVDMWFLDNNYVSVHVRRGDYVNLQNIHPIQSLDWYKQAMSLFSDTNFLIFSDDKEWCKENFKNATISPFDSPGEDMYAMTKCTGHIICNSSFSWWGAWLSKKPTIAPKNWYGLNGPQDWQDIYCDDWRIL